MNIKLMQVAALIFIVLISPAIASNQNVPIGKCSLPLDFGGQSVAIDPSEPSVEEVFTMDLTLLLMKDTATNSIGLIYKYDFIQPKPISTFGDSFSDVMKGVCARVSTEPYGNGFIATGLLKKGGQKCWGVFIPLDSNNDEMKEALMVIMMFKNETLNEDLVKNIKIESMKC